MNRVQKRLLGFAAALGVLLIALAVLYVAGMGSLEGESRSFWQGLEWAAETLTTTGYGADDTWRHPGMVLFVVAVQITGVLLVFLVFPLYLIPFLEERFEVRLPREAPDIQGHVLVYRYGAAVESLIEEMQATGVPVVVAEPDEDTARRLLEAGTLVFLVRDEDEALDSGRLASAKALLANGGDEENAGVILGARQMGYEGQIIAFVEEPMHRRPLALAGASAVYTPRHVLAAALAARASARISPRLSGIQQIGRLDLAELRVHRNSPLAGATLAEIGLGARTGATVIGQWVDGRLQALPGADDRLEPRGIVIVVGPEESLERTAALCEGPQHVASEGHFIVAGFGVVGSKVKTLLVDAGHDVLAVDREPHDGVDLVGDVREPDVLERADPARAQAVIVALDRDDLTLFTTTIVKDMAPEVPVIARVNHASNIDKIHLAGADFARSIAQVSAQIVARRLLGHDSVTLDPQLRIRRLPAHGLVGGTVVELDVRSRTGVSVVAMEREGEMSVEIGPDLRFERGDDVYVCGSDEGVRRFVELFGA